MLWRKLLKSTYIGRFTDIVSDHMIKVVYLPQVLTIGELLVDIIRKDVDVSLGEPADFAGPFPGGAPAIFADAVARLKMSSGIIGSVGKDEFGQCILRRLKKDGVDVTHVVENEHLSTAVAFVAYFSDGSRRFVFHVGNSAAGMIDVSDAEEYVKNASAVHISGSSLMMSEKLREACHRVVGIAKEAGAVISFDPNIRRELMSVARMKKIVKPVLEVCDLLIPSADEFRELCRADEEKGVKEMIDNGIKIVAVKDGDKGCRLYTKDEKVTARAFDVKELDPTGAGDAFSAGIVVGFLEKMNLGYLARFANAAGAKAVTAKGAMEGLAWREEIENMLLNIEGV